MGRPEQKEMEKKRAATGCYSLEHLLPPKRRKHISDNSTTDRSGLTPSCQSDHTTCSESTFISTTAVDHDQSQPMAAAAGSSAQAPVAALTDHDCGKDLNLQQPDNKTGGENSTAQVSMDIGAIYSECKTPGSVEFCSALRTLPSGDKYTLLKHHKLPPAGHVFPTTFLGGCNCSFRI